MSNRFDVGFMFTVKQHKTLIAFMFRFNLLTDTEDDVWQGEIEFERNSTPTTELAELHSARRLLN
jgi:hypothetical protein